LIRSGGRAARLRSAKPATAVRIRSRPHIKKYRIDFKKYFYICKPFLSLRFSDKICESSSVGRAQPCQGWGREFESRLSLYVLKSRLLEIDIKYLGGEIGRHAGLKILLAAMSVRVQVPPEVLFIQYKIFNQIFL
jgi:hypothetical protein